MFREGVGVGLQRGTMLPKGTAAFKYPGFPDSRSLMKAFQLVKDAMGWDQGANW